jgi:peroxiredoxin
LNQADAELPAESAKLEAADTQVLGVSMDSTFSNAAWAEKIAVTFPLRSDWGGDVTRQYGLYNPKYKQLAASTA